MQNIIRRRLSTPPPLMVIMRLADFIGQDDIYRHVAASLALLPHWSDQAMAVALCLSGSTGVQTRPEASSTLSIDHV